MSSQDFLVPSYNSCSINVSWAELPSSVWHQEETPSYYFTMGLHEHSQEFVIYKVKFLEGTSHALYIV